MPPAVGALTAEDVSRQALGEANKLLGECAAKIGHCVNQLSDEQIWWRPAASLNSIGNLMLHLCGNLEQWIVSGIGGAADTRQRPAEFAERGPMPKSVLIEKLTRVVAASQQTLAPAAPLSWRTSGRFRVLRSAAGARSSTRFRTSTATRRKSSATRGYNWARPTSSIGSRKRPSRERAEGACRRRLRIARRDLPDRGDVRLGHRFGRLRSLGELAGHGAEAGAGVEGPLSDDGRPVEIGLLPPRPRAQRGPLRPST